MTTGMRRAEVAGLRWQNVDLDAEVVEIRRSNIHLATGTPIDKDASKPYSPTRSPAATSA
jgi:integrase